MRRHLRRLTTAATIAATTNLISAGCGGPDREGDINPSATTTEPIGGDKETPPGGSSAEGASGEDSGPGSTFDGNVVDGVPDQDGPTPAAPDDSTGAAPPGGGAGITDGDGAPGEPCVPGSGQVSSPGRYEGYSEVRYDDHERSSFHVEVRDGTRLAMDLFRPVDDDGEVVSEPLPVLWMHTPYNRRTFISGSTAETYPGFALRLVKYGYVVAIVDFRGLFASFGTNTAYNRGEWVDAARMDGYDITEWLAEQPWSSGEIGMWGCSATGGSQLQAATTAPPHLKAIFPMSCEFDAYSFGVPGGMAAALGATRTAPGGAAGAIRGLNAAAVDGSDGRALLDQAIAEHEGGLANAGHAPYRDSEAENIPEQWWLKSSPHTYLDMLKDSGIGVYLAANWNEGATKYGAFFTFHNLSPATKLLVGPEGHCEWSAVKEETGFDLVVEELRFFDHWLKGVENCVMEEAPVYYYTYNGPGDGWQAATAWPLPDEQRTLYYLGEETLTTALPTDGGASDTIAASDSDASKLVYASEPLAKAMQVTGHPVVELWVSSTATDGDFIATLEDVAPDGGATSYFMDGRLRASHRAEQDPPYGNLGLPWHPFTEAALTPLVPEEPTRLAFDLLPTSIIFEKGHRVRVVLTFAGAATPSRSPAPMVTVYRDADHPSSITLPVIE